MREDEFAGEVFSEMSPLTTDNFHKEKNADSRIVCNAQQIGRLEFKEKRMSQLMIWSECARRGQWSRARPNDDCELEFS